MGALRLLFVWVLWILGSSTASKKDVDSWIASPDSFTLSILSPPGAEEPPLASDPQSLPWSTDLSHKTTKRHKKVHHKAKTNPHHHHHRRVVRDHHHKKSRKIRRHGQKEPHKHLRAFQEQHRHFSQELPPVVKEPTFDHSMPTYVTAQLGSPAFLSCRILNLADKTVSWIRNRDAHILTVDRYTFIADSRFATWFEPETDTWTLQIKFSSPGDAGRYECQVSSEPKKSHFVTLAVVTPRVEIPGGSELHVQRGSDVVLKCVISRALEPPPYVFWYHEDLSALDGSVSTIVHQAPIEMVSKDSCVASLAIRSVGKRHAGNYTCAPAGITRSSSVLLHVLKDEHPAAMQHTRNAALKHSANYWWFSVLLLIKSIVLSIVL